MSLISLDKVNFRYGHTGDPIFNHISLEFKPGRIYGLLGANGIGKSTLFRLIAGMNRVSSGTIRVLGQDPWLRHPSLMSEIAIIPEVFDTPSVPVQVYARRLGAFYPHFDMDAFVNFTEQFEIDNTMTLRQMSQGQRKKAVISFALACRTKIVLMDEPTNGIDIPGKEVLRHVIEAEADDSRLFVISTHQVRDLEGLINAAVVFNADHNIGLCADADDLLNAMHFGDLTEANAADVICRMKYQANIGICRRGTMPKQKRNALDLELLFAAVQKKEQMLNDALEQRRGDGA